MGFYMGTTEIPSEKTASEISSLLSVYGANQILTDHKDGEIVGLSFMIEKNGVRIPFKLPIRWEAIFTVMYKSKPQYGSTNQKAQAKRTSWRLVLRWIQAQLALVDTKAVELDEVFLPYAQMSNGQTVYKMYQEAQFKMLEAPK